MGETYDARMEMPGWNTAGFTTDDRWRPAVAADEGGRIAAPFFEPGIEREVDLGFTSPAIDGYAAQSRLGKTIKPKKVSVFGPALGKWGIEHYGKGTAKVDAVDFYLARLDHLKSVILQGQKEAIAKPEPSAFVTFK